MSNSLNTVKNMKNINNRFYLDLYNISYMKYFDCEKI